MKFAGFVGPSYVSQSKRAADQQCMNWYVENLEVADETFPTALYPTPGVESFVTEAKSPVRGMVEQNGRCFAVIGDTLYELFSDGTSLDISAIGGNTTVDAASAIPATFAANVDAGDEIFVTSGEKGYILTLSTNVFVEVKDDAGTPQSLNVTQGEFLDGYFLGLDTDNSTLKISDLNDGTTWPTTQIALRTAGGDKWQAVVVAHRDIWLFGQQTRSGITPGPARSPLPRFPARFWKKALSRRSPPSGLATPWCGLERARRGPVSFTWPTAMPRSASAPTRWNLRFRATRARG